MARILEIMRDIVIGIGIAIILPMLVYSGVRIFSSQDLHVFYADVAVGFLALIAGGLVNVVSLSFGLIFGGIICFISGYGRVWDTITPALRFSSLLIALLLLTGLTIKLTMKRKQ